MADKPTKKPVPTGSVTKRSNPGAGAVVPPRPNRALGNRRGGNLFHDGGTGLVFITDRVGIRGRLGKLAMRCHSHGCRQIRNRLVGATLYRHPLFEVRELREKVRFVQQRIRSDRVHNVLRCHMPLPAPCQSLHGAKHSFDNELANPIPVLTRAHTQGAHTVRGRKRPSRRSHEGRMVLNRYGIG